MAVNFRGEVKRVDCTSGRKLDEEEESPPPLLSSLCPNRQYLDKDLSHQHAELKVGLWIAD